MTTKAGSAAPDPAGTLTYPVDPTYPNFFTVLPLSGAPASLHLYPIDQLLFEVLAGSGEADPALGVAGKGA